MLPSRLVLSMQYCTRHYYLLLFSRTMFPFHLVILCDYIFSHWFLRAREPDLWDRVGVLHPLLLPGHGGTRTKVRPILEFVYSSFRFFKLNLYSTGTSVPVYRYSAFCRPSDRTVGRPPGPKFELGTGSLEAATLTSDH